MISFVLTLALVAQAPDLRLSIEQIDAMTAAELGEGPPAVLPTATLEENFARVRTANGSLASGYGVGFQVIRRGELIAVGHGGSVAGYQAACYLDRASRTGVIVLRNASGGAFQGSTLCLRALEKLAGSTRGPGR
jgi:CubicO group peptidase (beta-lactamase class C family)